MAEQTPVLKIFVLGSPEVHLGEHLVTFTHPQVPGLADLPGNRGGLQLREHLAVLLLPEASPELSYASLRNTLGQLPTTLCRSDGQTLPPTYPSHTLRWT